MSEEYDVQQVCENGHQITDCYNTCPEKRKDFCQECGAATLTACAGCGVDIQGAQIPVSQRKTLETLVFVPPYCTNCGKPYPWTERRIQTPIQSFIRSDNLDEEENNTIERDIENIAKDVPEAAISARRIKRIWDKYVRGAFKVIIDLVSSTIAKMLKEP